MRKIATILSLLTVILFLINSGFSQSTLSAGDLAIVGMNCDDPDDFAFLLLVDIEAATEIKFTDNGWLAAGGFRTGEGIQTYTAPSAITAGIVIVFSQNSGDFTSSGSFALAAAGDQLLVYQGLEASPTFIYAINDDGAGVWQADATTSNTSSLPSGLTNGVNAVAINEADNIIYNGSTNFATPALALASISDNTNWVGDDANRYDFTIFGDFSLPVTLSAFTARAGDRIVTLRWVTESEKDNVGFEILRSNQEEGNYDLLSSYVNNEALKGQLNSNQQTVYKFVDKLVGNDITYWYKLVDVDLNGVKTFHGPISATPHAVGNEIVNTNPGNLPRDFALQPNYPNPFNPNTTLSFDVPQLTSGNVEATLFIYNSLGQQVKVLYQGKIAAGNYKVEWDGTNESGSALPSGIYYATLRADYFSKTIKMMYMK